MSYPLCRSLYIADVPPPLLLPQTFPPRTQSRAAGVVSRAACIACAFGAVVNVMTSPLALIYPSSLSPESLNRRAFDRFFFLSSSQQAQSPVIFHTDWATCLKHTETEEQEATPFVGRMRALSVVLNPLLFLLLFSYCPSVVSWVPLTALFIGKTLREELDY